MQGFLDDVRDFLDLPDSTWDSALHVAPGQPFRLGLWKLLLREMGDPDFPFLDELHTGVRLGVHNEIPVSPLWPMQPSTISDHQDLIQCESSWKSTLDQPDVVWQFLQEEIDGGFIERVPGGLAQLQQDHEHTAVGKLGLACADNSEGPGREQGRGHALGPTLQAACRLSYEADACLVMGGIHQQRQQTFDLAARDNRGRPRGRPKAWPSKSPAGGPQRTHAQDAPFHKLVARLRPVPNPPEVVELNSFTAHHQHYPSRM